MRAIRPASVAVRRRIVFETATRAQLRALRDEVAELKRRVNGLLWAVAAAVFIEILKALLK
jgi:hypothetical protein